MLPYKFLMVWFWTLTVSLVILLLYNTAVLLALLLFHVLLSGKASPLLRFFKKIFLGTLAFFLPVNSVFQICKKSYWNWLYRLVLEEFFFLKFWNLSIEKYGISFQMFLDLYVVLWYFLIHHLGLCFLIDLFIGILWSFILWVLF